MWQVERESTALADLRQVIPILVQAGSPVPTKVWLLVVAAVLKVWPLVVVVVPLSAVREPSLKSQAAEGHTIPKRIIRHPTNKLQ